ncbi:protein of unknown function [Paenibacillus algorifonticola]|uniref:DUF4190 domain-containing protein n=1 Tax=Paenibacillus algorifonticola TaxID=684063 RepID=A0A1I2B8F8_9BACL|nr:DUF4190 domain-containing protein [Paenibacillus algorifonticola]SFE52492.1 protein of unknown function [Paenibacillus algorifonticola]
MNDYNNGHNYQNNAPFQPPVQKTNGAAIAALVCGITSFIPFIGVLLGIVAVVMGIVSLNQIPKTREQGRGMAIAGLICGAISLFLSLLLFLLFIIGMLSYEDSMYNYGWNESYYNASIQLVNALNL